MGLLEKYEKGRRVRGAWWNDLINRLAGRRGLITGNSITIFKDGDYAVALNNIGEELISDKDHSKVIQTGLNSLVNGGKVFIKGGTYILNDYLSLKSNLNLELEHNTILKLADNKDLTMLYGNGISNFSLSGGIIDGNSTNQSPPPSVPWSHMEGHGLYLLNSSQITIRNIQFKDIRQWSICLRQVDNGNISNILFDTGKIIASDTGLKGSHQDGLHLTDCNRITVNNLYGIVGDEFFGISGGDLTGETYKISASNIVGISYAGSLVYLHPTTGNLRQISISNVVSELTGRGIIRIKPSAGAYVEDVSIIGFEGKSWGDTGGNYGGPGVEVDTDVRRLTLIGKIGSPSTATMNLFSSRVSVKLHYLVDSTIKVTVRDVKDDGRGVDAYEIDKSIIEINGDYVHAGKVTINEFVVLNNAEDNLIKVRLTGGKRSIWIRGTSLRNKIAGIMLGADLNSVYETDTSDYNLIEGCKVDKPISWVGANTQVRRNDGFVTENSGTETIVAGNTYVDVIHKLDITPSLEKISLTPQTDLEGRDIWVSNPTSTTFRINISSVDTKDNVIGWRYS